MSLKYRSASGQETLVSGIAPNGNIEAGAVAQKTVSATIDAKAAGASGTVAVTFSNSEEMPDTDYIVNVNCIDESRLVFSVRNKTKTGFTLVYRNVSDSATSACTVVCTAIKTYTVQHAEQNAEDIADIKSMIPANASSANKFATAADLENIEIDVDDELSDESENPVQNKVVKGAIDAKQDAVEGKGLSTNDFTDADEEKLDNCKTIFTGTQAQWTALSAAEKAKYTLVSLTDDGGSGLVVDQTVIQNSPNPVSGGGVYNAIHALEIPEKTSDLTNDSGFITKAVDDLTNYYTKTNTYTKTEVDTLITNVKNGRFEVVASLPTTDIKTNVIYLVPSADPQTANAKDEYINLDGTTSGWELIGSTAIDLSNYVQKSQTAGLLKNDGSVDTNTYAKTSDLGTAAAKDSTTSVIQNSGDLVTSGGVYTYVDTMITQALTGSY